jgi:hypothetical protein
MVVRPERHFTSTFLDGNGGHLSIGKEMEKYAV